jgi:hypothetical protein
MSSPGQRLVPWKVEIYTDSLVIQPSTENVFRTVKSTGFGTLTQNSTTTTYGALSGLTLSNLCTDYTSLQAVFDQYKIVKIEVVFMTNSTAIAASTAIGDLYTVLDYDDSTALSSIGSVQAYSNCITSHPGQSQRRCFRPRVAVAAYSTGGFTQYKNEAAGWIDSASATVQHFGVKYALDVGTAGSLLIYVIQVRTEIMFRASR